MEDLLARLRFRGISTTWSSPSPRHAIALAHTRPPPLPSSNARGDPCTVPKPPAVALAQSTGRWSGTSAALVHSWQQSSWPGFLETNGGHPDQQPGWPVAATRDALRLWPLTVAVSPTRRPVGRAGSHPAVVGEPGEADDPGTPTRADTRGAAIGACRRSAAVGEPAETNGAATPTRAHAR